VIDQSRVADGYLFATRTYRYLYVGQWSWEKPQWLKDNPDKWRRIEDVQREAASPAAPVKSEVNVVAAFANGQIISEIGERESAPMPSAGR
jgi:hypothetical protein